MTKTQHIILYQFAGGKSIQKICKGKVASYDEVKRWLTLPEELLSSTEFFTDTAIASECVPDSAREPVPAVSNVPIVPAAEALEALDCLEFRRHYNTILKNSIPLFIEELREDAEELHLFAITDKKDREDIPPAVWKKFKARLGAIKFLQSFFNTRHSLGFTQKEAEYDEFNNPQSQIRNPQSGNPQSSGTPQFDWNYESDLTPEEVEAIIGSPIHPTEEYYQRHPEHRDYKERQQKAKLTKLSAENQDKAFAPLSENFAPLCENQDPEGPSATQAKSAIDNINLTTEGSNPQSAIKKIRICPQYGNQCECSSEPNSCGPAQYADEEPEPMPKIVIDTSQIPSPENGFYLKCGKFIFTNNTT